MDEKPPFINEVRPVLSIQPLRPLKRSCSECPNYEFCHTHDYRLLVLLFFNKTHNYVVSYPCTLCLNRGIGVLLGWGERAALLRWINSQKKYCYTHRQDYHSLPYATRAIGVCCGCLNNMKEKIISETGKYPEKIYAVRGEKR